MGERGVKNIASVIIIVFIVALAVVYIARPHSTSIVVKPTNTSYHTTTTGKIIVQVSTASIKLSEQQKTSSNVFEKYVKKYYDDSLAFSVSNNKTVYYLPARDYTAVSHAIIAVLDARTTADKYYTIIADPIAGIRKLKYCDKYRTDVIEFVNDCGNDLNFFEAYAFVNAQTPYTMIIAINPATSHVAYVFGSSVYDIFNTYKYRDYIERIIYKYNPTTAYMVVFDDTTYSMSPIPLITGAHRADVEATGSIDGKPITIVVRDDYFLLTWHTVNITRNGMTFIYNNATLNYYPINYMKIEPIEPVVVNITDTNYVYIMGTTYTLIPTMNITDTSITIIAYKVFRGPTTGSITVTYYG